jgi:tetratricopeptide (TPR) repeat protein
MAGAAPAALLPVTAKGNGSADGGGDDIEIELDIGGGSPNNLGADVSDDGFAEAEAALEAMQSFRLAEAALQRNDIAGAEKLAQKAVDGDPTQVDYVTLLSWIRALGNAPPAVEEAIATMTRVLADDPSSERALLYRGKLLSRTNRYQEALADFNELLAANPQHRDAQAEVRHLKSKT